MTPSTPIIQWHASLAQIPESDWTGIFGTTSALTSFSLTRAVEDARIQNVSLHFLTASDHGHAVAIIPCFCLRARLDLLASPRVKAFAGFARRIFPRFLTRRTLFLGLPIAICDHLFGIGIDEDDPRFPALIAGVKGALDAKAREQKCTMIVAKDFRTGERDRFARMLGPEFTWMESLPNAFVPVGGELPPYPAPLRHKYRNNVNRALDESGRLGLAWAFADDFAALAPEMGRLYVQVLSRSQTPVERLDERFFRAVATHCRGFAYALTCSTQSGQLVCFWLAIEDQRALAGLYMGMDYAHPHAAGMYVEGTIRLIMEAERRGKRYIICGQNAMVPKANAGAVFERIWLAARARNPVMALGLRYGGHRLSPPAQPPRVRCYTDQAAAAIRARLASERITFEPIKTTGD